MSGTWQRWLWIGVALALHLAAAVTGGWRNSAAPSANFAIPQPDRQPAASAPPVYHEELIDPQFCVPSVHVSSLCELSDGGLAAAWYGGTREGARDVAVFLARHEPGDRGTWSAPRPLVTPQTAAQETFRFVKKVGNPLLFSGADGRLDLIYVSIAVGGWSGSSLNLKQSFDDGQSWTSSRRLGLSPFFNVSELVKNGPVRLADGGWAVPIYHETCGKFPEVLWLDTAPGGMRSVRSRAFGGRTAFQPSLVALDARRALLLCRTAGPVRRIYLARTEDGGNHWSEPQPSELPNPDSGLDALRLKDGRLLLAFNDSSKDRHNLRLAVSIDQGVTWRRVATLAAEAGSEFSYPFMLQTRDGLVHVTYTWKRRGIKHVSFNLAWLDSQSREVAQ